MHGLNYAKDVGMEVLRKEIPKLQIPNQRGHDSSVDWELNNIQIRGFALPNPAIATVPGQGVQVTIINVGLAVHFDFKFKRTSFPKISGGGGGDASVLRTNMGIAIQITNHGGRPHVNVIGVGFSIGDFNLKLSGSWSWLYNIIISIFKGRIKKMIEDGIRKVIADVINAKLNSALATIPIVVGLGGGASKMGLDYSLVGNPVFTPTHITIPQKGEFYNWNGRGPSEHQASPTPDLINPGKMIQVIVTDYMPLTVTEQFHKRGFIKIVLEDKHIPSWSPIRLKTSSFSLILPSLNEKFPNHDLQVHVQSTVNPVINYLPDGLLVQIRVDLKWFAVEGTTLKHAFTTNCLVSCKSIASIKGMNLVAQLIFLNQDNTLTATEIGQFNVKVIDNLMNLLYEKGLVPIVNVLISDGVPLPSINHLELVNPQLVWGARYLAVLTDMRIHTFFSEEEVEEQEKKSELGKLLEEAEDKQCSNKIIEIRKIYEKVTEEKQIEIKSQIYESIRQKYVTIPFSNIEIYVDQLFNEFFDPNFLCLAFKKLIKN